jgi:hypothetical protein
VSNVYQYGNTVRLECDFFDFDNTSVDTQLVKVVIYDAKYEILSEIVLGEVNRKAVGKYFFDYTSGNTAQKYYYEWYGEIDGTPSLNRGQFATKFI